jgi:abhydrolase domain-containing protein 17
MLRSSPVAAGVAAPVTPSQSIGHVLDATFMHQPMLKLLLVAAITYLAIAAVVYLVADRLIFLPPASSYAEGELPIVRVSTEDGVAVATLHLAGPEDALTILFSHGNAEDLGHLVPFLERLRETGFSVLAYDYRGYGLSGGGPPTAAGASRDLRAVYRYATEELGIPASRLILHGRSVGTGPATELAAREPVGGLVIESGFVSAFRVVTRAPLLPFDRFPNLHWVRRLRAPLLVIHGSDDEVIPVSHGRRLHDAAPEPKQALWVAGAGHNDLLLVAGDRYWAALRDFGETALRHAGTAAP